MKEPSWSNDLRAAVGSANVITDIDQLRRRAPDHYYFSPVLKPQLDGLHAEALVRPTSVAELRAAIQVAVAHGVPITPRGAGTGNYGQGVPLKGGIQLEFSGLATIEHLSLDKITVQAGAKLIDMERKAREIGAELRYFPSTLMTATAGGFLAGGAGGIGSVTWGTMWDEGNVLDATIMTIEPEPRLIHVAGADALKGVVHNCGLTCIIVTLTFALAPARAWQQHVAAFAGLDDAIRYAWAISADDAVHKRLVCLLDARIPPMFKQLQRAGAAPAGMHLVLMELAHDPAEIAGRTQASGGVLTFHTAADKYHATGTLWLSDFSWNHTTLWAMKADPAMTYLQDMFDVERFWDQHRARSEKFPDELFLHLEFMKFGGTLRPQGLSLVRFTTRDRLWEIMDFCESIGQWMANPHTHRLDEDVRWNGQPILDAKKLWDPDGLLNPGHLASTV